jgi:hypothetical protein
VVGELHVLAMAGFNYKLVQTGKQCWKERWMMNARKNLWKTCALASVCSFALAISAGRFMTIRAQGVEDHGVSLQTVARERRIVWENRSQPEFSGSAVDGDGGGRVVIMPGNVGDESFNTQWFVRGLDQRSDATKWEDRFGPMIFGAAKDVAVEGGRGFVAGWILTPGVGYDLSFAHTAWTAAPCCGPSRSILGRNALKCSPALLVASQKPWMFMMDASLWSASHAHAGAVGLCGLRCRDRHASLGKRHGFNGTGANDYAWAVRAEGNSLFVLGEVRDYSGLLLQSHDARTGAIRWQQQWRGQATPL